jgi:glycine cleavage system aminomethyltransferase T
MMSGALLKTPFHARTQAANPGNEWTARGRFTVPSRFSGVAHEAIAARHGAILADLTPLHRLWLRGEGAASLLDAACGAGASRLPSGESRNVIWTNAAGAVRGTGNLARFGAASFLLSSFAPDTEWFAAAAPRFGAELVDETHQRGVLLVTGPAAAFVLAEAGIDQHARLEPMQQTTAKWRGRTLTLSRWLTADGYEVGCFPVDAVELFDFLHDAGKVHGLVLAGQHAIELLFLETGRLIPGLDFDLARDDAAREPSVASLGLGNGETSSVLAGVEWDRAEEEPLRFLFRNPGKYGASALSPDFLYHDQAVGEIRRAAYSPALRRMIAVAMISKEFAVPGTELLLRRVGRTGIKNIAARIVARPFLP